MTTIPQTTLCRLMPLIFCALSGCILPAGEPTGRGSDGRDDAGASPVTKPTAETNDTDMTAKPSPAPTSAENAGSEREGVDEGSLAEQIEARNRAWRESGSPLPPGIACFAPGSAAKHAYIGAGPGVAGPKYEIGDFFIRRWDRTMTNGQVLDPAKPVTITWSIVPDGTTIYGAYGEATSGSKLQARLNGLYPGGKATWLPLLQSSFKAWEDISGIRFVYLEEDDGVGMWPLNPHPGAFDTQSKPLRGDIRIGGHRIDGNYGVLAYAFMPNLGDIVVDTKDVSLENKRDNSVLLRNTMMHELGHALGMGHVCPANRTKLMEPFLSTSMDGPQHDDLRGIQRAYGDRFEVDQRNDSPQTAVDLQAIGAAGLGVKVDEVSIHRSFTNNSIFDFDSDYYRFTLSERIDDLAVVLTPQGKRYPIGPQSHDGSCGSATEVDARAQSDLALELLDQQGNVLASAPQQEKGKPLIIGDIFDRFGAGPFFIHVYPEDDVPQTQLYQISLREELCGNGRLDNGEFCDGASLGANRCTTLGFAGGTLACSAACSADTAQCTFPYELASVSGVGAVAANDRGYLAGFINDTRIAVRHFDAQGRLTTKEPIILAEAQGSERLYGKLAMAGSKDGFLVVWEDHRPQQAGLWGARFTADGQNHDVFPIVRTHTNARNADVVGRLDDFYVVWEQTEAGKNSVQGALIRGTSVLSRRELSGGQSPARNPHVAANATENSHAYLVVWEHIGDVIGRFVSTNGSLPSTELLAIVTGPLLEQNPVVATSGPNYVVAWHDLRSGGQKAVYVKTVQARTGTVGQEEREIGRGLLFRPVSYEGGAMMLYGSYGSIYYHVIDPAGASAAPSVLAATNARLGAAAFGPAGLMLSWVDKIPGTRRMLSILPVATGGL